MSSTATPVQTFVQKAEGDAVAILDNAYTQGKDLLLNLGETALADLKAALNTAINDAEAGDSIETIETAVLNLLSADSLALIQALPSGLIQMLIAAGKSVVADL